MFKVKICGVRLKSDVDAVGRAGGDAIGLNFFPQSVRFVDPDSGATHQLADAAAEQGIAAIGVFVNAGAEDVGRIADDLRLTAVQLHGDESTSVASDLRGRDIQVIRAIKLPIAGLTADLVDQLCDPWQQIGCHLLLDADAGAAHGGSGKCLDWQVVRSWATGQVADSWTLAGGLTPENVGQAIDISGATSVDTASGAEQPRGTKSPERIRSFIQAALAARNGG